MIVALAGGVGGAKLAAGLAKILAPLELTVVVNTGDDFEHLGLHLSPDLDTVMYNLAGIHNPHTGWGRAGESWQFMRALEALGGETWFRLGDRDLATHVERTRRLQSGEKLSSVTVDFCQRMGIRHAVVPMSDDSVRTVVHTDRGLLPFQEYFVKLQCQPRVHRIEFRGAAQAQLSSGFGSALEADALRGVILCPSNPFLSVAPILAVAEVTPRLKRHKVPIIAVSPIVGGRAIKGPAAKLFVELGKEASALEVARYYQGIIDGLVIDEVDRALAEQIRKLGIRPFITHAVMKNDEDKAHLAKEVLGFNAELAARG